MDSEENWAEAGDIVVPSGNFVHVYWNLINWKVAIRYEDEKAGGEKMMILQRVGQITTAASPEEATRVADKFYNGNR